MSIHRLAFTRWASRRWTAWLTAWVVLLGALAPSVSHGLAQAAAAGQLGLICSSSTPGATAALNAPSGADAVDAAGGLTPADWAQPMAHCPFCLPHDGSLGLPPVASSFHLPALPLRQALPPLFAHAPRPLFAWHASQPRAPPAVA